MLALTPLDVPYPLCVRATVSSFPLPSLLLYHYVSLSSSFIHCLCPSLPQYCPLFFYIVTSSSRYTCSFCSHSLVLRLLLSFAPLSSPPAIIPAGRCITHSWTYSHRLEASIRVSVAPTRSAFVETFSSCDGCAEPPTTSLSECRLHYISEAYKFPFFFLFPCFFFIRRMSFARFFPYGKRDRTGIGNWSCCTRS